MMPIHYLEYKYIYSIMNFFLLKFIIIQSYLYFRNKYPERKPFGVWITCFIAFLNNDEFVTKFLNNWYLQTLKYTTEDQIGFPYVCQKMHFSPYTLPDNEIQGLEPHIKTDFYTKYEHGI